MQIVKMPQTGLKRRTTIYTWKKRTGDLVKKGEALCEIECGKTTMTVRSRFDGVLNEIIVKEGEYAEAGLPIAYIEED